MKNLTMLAGLTLLAGLTAAVPDTTGAAVHFALSKSAPEADWSGPSPSEVRLWFTEEPQENSIAIRLVDAHGELIETPDATPDAGDVTVFSTALEHELVAGSYTVAWRGIGSDGHAVRGDFTFTVTAR